MEEAEVGAAEALLRFMYTGGLEAGAAGSAVELLRILRLADRFQVRDVAGGCQGSQGGGVEFNRWGGGRGGEGIGAAKGSGQSSGRLSGDGGHLAA